MLLILSYKSLSVAFRKAVKDMLAILGLWRIK